MPTTSITLKALPYLISKASAPLVEKWDILSHLYLGCSLIPELPLRGSQAAG